MATLEDIITFFCIHYPYKSELSKARLTKLVYLADWKSAIDRGEQLTDITWYYHNYGPFVHDVTDEAQKSQRFVVESTTNAYGNYKELVKLKSKNYKPILSKKEEEILRHVIKQTRDKYWNSFIELVYSTYPIIKSDKFSKLNLVALAEDYAKYKSSLESA